LNDTKKKRRNKNSKEKNAIRLNKPKQPRMQKLLIQELPSFWFLQHAIKRKLGVVGSQAHTAL